MHFSIQFSKDKLLEIQETGKGSVKFKSKRSVPDNSQHRKGPKAWNSSSTSESIG